MEHHHLLPGRLIAKVNSQTFTPGASILFKKGDTWTGETITVNSSGNASNPITYSSYGSGAQPVISGFTTITSWTDEGGGIYSKVIATQSAPNMVMVNGENTAKGRYPNAGGTNGGYLVIDSHVGDSSIADDDLNSAITNWTGAELIIKKNRWMIERIPITNHVGNTLTYISANAGYDAIDGYGYFIQNDIRTLDIIGEWAYRSGKLYMYFGAANPNDYTVKLATTDNLISITHNYIHVVGLTLEGANSTGIYSTYTTGVNVKNCNILYSGIYGINFSSGMASYLIENNFINQNNYSGIRCVAANTYTGGVVRYNTVKNVGLLVGMTQPQGGMLEGIFFNGENGIVEYNTVDSIGYVGIHFDPTKNNNKIRYNQVSNFLLTKDDGAGIYGWKIAYNGATGIEITNNLVWGGVGSHDGVFSGHTTNLAMGIYLDNFSENILVKDNSIWNCAGGGIFLGNHARNSILRDNLIYNCNYGIWSQRLSTSVTDPNFTIMNNVVFNTTTNKYLVFIDGSNPVLLGSLDNNYYSRPLAETDVFRMSYPNYHAETLAQWKVSSGQDLNSHTSPVTINDPNDILFEYNATTSNKVVSLGSNTYVDVTGATYTGSVTLSPYTSIILIKTN
jgi:hypothetical protein